MKTKRLDPISPESAQGEVKQIYQHIKDKMNIVPNIFCNMANSPAVLKGYFALSDAAAQTSLSPKLREKIALTVGQANNCNYCLSAHTLIGKAAGLQENEILEARKGNSKDTKEKAILLFVKNVVDKKGLVSDEEVETLKAAGVSHKELVEIIFIININIFTNYFNHITDTEIDFPRAPDL